MDTLIRKIEIPKMAKLIADRSDIYYADCYTLDIPKGVSCFSIYNMMTSNLPWWVGSLFSLRDKLVAPFSIEPVFGFTSAKSEGDMPEVGGHLDFFTVREYREETMTLTIHDRHLDVMIHLNKLEKDVDVDSLYLTSSVKTHNLIGKLYMVLVSIGHRIIVRLLLKKLQNNCRV